jgi:hypothetical protein
MWCSCTGTYLRQTHCSVLCSRSSTKACWRHLSLIVYQAFANLVLWWLPTDLSHYVMLLQARLELTDPHPYRTAFRCSQVHRVAGVKRYLLCLLYKHAIAVIRWLALVTEQQC